MMYYSYSLGIIVTFCIITILIRHNNRGLDTAHQVHIQLREIPSQEYYDLTI